MPEYEPLSVGSSLVPQNLVSAMIEVALFFSRVLSILLYIFSHFSPVASSAHFAMKLAAVAKALPPQRAQPA